MANDEGSRIFERADISGIEQKSALNMKLDGDFMLPPIHMERSALFGKKLITEDIDLDKIGG